MTSPALLFPGQGSQEPGMGRDLAEADSGIMDFWKQAERISGLPLRAIYWEGDDAAMADTRNLQPALTVVNLALWMKLAPKVAPACAAGHSLGEYSALAAAGVLPMEVVLELVSLRGRLMAEADPDGKGAMAAIVKLSPEQLDACVKTAREASGELLVVANYNTPVQTVVSGTRAAIARVQEEAKNLKGRAIPLAVSGAFHSPLMQEASSELAKAINGLGKGVWSKARFPVYSNATATGDQDPDVLKERLIRQMTSSVYWVDTITRQWDAGIRVFVECGPKGVLGKMVDPILNAHPSAAAASGWSVHNVGSAQQLQDAAL